MRVCDWIANYVYDQGVKRIHGLTGGGAMGLNDGFIKHPELEYIAYHHEQGAGHAAIGESKFTGKPSVVNPTTGCGGTNCITSVLNAWQDSVPVIFISGNVKLENCSRWINKTKKVNIRKLGVQEHDIINTVESITKKAFFVSNIYNVAEVLQEAFFIAQSGRPGPVWIDIPADIQSALMPSGYLNFIPPKEKPIPLKNKKEISDILKNASRPLVLAGYGIRQSNTLNHFVSFIKQHNIPYVSTYGARDYLAFDDPLNIGTVGIKGSRAGNFALQNADVLLVLGCSLGTSVTGYDSRQFNPKAKKIVIDIDQDELNKDIVDCDYKVAIDLKSFFYEMVRESAAWPFNQEWIDKCNEWKNKWPVINDDHLTGEGEVDIYAVLNHVNKFSDPKDVLMGDAGSISYAGPVALESKINQRFIFSPAQADMGWALPASIGVAMASGQQVIAIIGDGSFMSNLQELAVVREHWLNIKFVILNNDGYLSIRNTQSRFYNRVHGTDSKSGLWFPDFFDVANTFDMAYVECLDFESLSKLKAVFASDGPVIVNCLCKYDQQILPAQSYRDGLQAPLHDMAPFLDKEEIRKEMFYKDLI